MSSRPRPVIGQRRGERRRVGQAPDRAVVEELAVEMQDHAGQADAARPASRRDSRRRARRPAARSPQRAGRRAATGAATEKTQRDVFGLRGESGSPSARDRCRGPGRRSCARTNDLDPELVIGAPAARRVRAAMLPPQFVGLRAQLTRARQHRVVAMPLHEVGAAHERAVLRRPAVVVPEIEVDEVDRRRERRGRQHAVLPQRRHDVRRRLHLRRWWSRPPSPPPRRRGRRAASCGTATQSCFIAACARSWFGRGFVIASAR